MPKSIQKYHYPYSDLAKIQLIQTRARAVSPTPLQFSTRRAPTGLIMMALEIFSVNVTYKKIIGRFCPCSGRAGSPHPPTCSKSCNRITLYRSFHREFRLGGWGTEGLKSLTLG